jgi:hypothetical protein
MTLKGFLTRLILLCVLPLVILAAWLGYDNVRTQQAQRNSNAGEQARHVAELIDSKLGAQIGALQLLAASPLVDEPARWAELYRQAQGFRHIFGSHVILADPAMQMRFNTRAPFGAALPHLPTSPGRTAAPLALASGEPAVGDIVYGPVARQPLVAMAVPVLRQGRVAYLLLSTLEGRQFQQLLDGVALPHGWDLSVRDSQGEVIAQRGPSDHGHNNAGNARHDPDAGHYVAQPALAPWSVVLDAPHELLHAPIFKAVIFLAMALFIATLASILGGGFAGRRLNRAVTSLVEPPLPGVTLPAIAEIDQVRQLLADTTAARDTALATQRAGEERFQQLFDAAPIPLCFVDSHGTLAEVNARFHTMFGYDRADVPTLDAWRQRAYPDPAYRRWVTDTWNDAVQRATASGSDIEPIEYQVSCKDGKVCTVLISGITFGDGFLATFFDLTERKAGETALRESEARFQATFEQAAVGIAMLAPDGHWLRVNRKLCEIVGYSRDELLVRSFQDITHPDDLATDLEHVRKILAGEIQAYTIEKRYLTKAGDTVWINLTVALVRKADATPDYFISVV